MVDRAEDFREFRIWEATALYPGSWYQAFLESEADLPRCTTVFCIDRLQAQMLANRAGALRAFQYAYGWEIVRDYREWTAQEMRNALASASPYAYGLTSARRLVVVSRSLRPGGNACVTKPDTVRDPDTGVGAYSTAAHPSGLSNSYRLEYSGDGSSDSGTPGSPGAMRPVSYRMINGSELFDIWLDSGVYYYHGYLSLDVERDRIWNLFDPIYRAWLRTGEAYEGLAPGYCPDGGCDTSAVPMDWGRLEHQGPVRWYGAMVIGGTGGCTLAVDARTDVDGKPPQASVMEQNQRIVCLLPLNAVPDGRCPGESLR